MEQREAVKRELHILDLNAGEKERRLRRAAEESGNALRWERDQAVKERDQLKIEIDSLCKAAAAEREQIPKQARSEAHRGILWGISDVTTGALPESAVAARLGAGMTPDELALLPEFQGSRPPRMKDVQQGG